MANKVVAWIVLLLGIYEILSLLIGGLPAILTGTLGWIVGLLLLILGLYLVMKK